MAEAPQQPTAKMDSSSFNEMCFQLRVKPTNATT